jgi:hypothetical protein
MSSPAKLKPAQAPLVVTANRLLDGRVVWLAADFDWHEDIAHARIFDPEQGEAAQALGRAGERARIVIGAYPIEVVLRGGIPEPLKFRERLRLHGPSVATVPFAPLLLAPLPLAS